MPAPRGVFVDLVGTLIELDTGVGYQYAKLAEHESLDLDPAVIDLEFPQALRCVPLFDWGVDATLEDIALREKISWHGAVARIVNKAHLPQNEPVPEFDAFFKKLFPHFTRAEVWKIHEDVVPCLEGLMRDGYVIGLVSNFDLRVFPLLDNLGLSRLFDSVTVPGVAHAAKPSPAIFSFALSRHSLTPEETVYVGDSLDDDVEGARGAGLQPILIDRNERHADITSVPRITTLAGLRPLLRSMDSDRKQVAAD